MLKRSGVKVKYWLSKVPYAKSIKRKLFSSQSGIGVAVSYPSDRRQPQFSEIHADDEYNGGSFVLYRVLGNDLYPRHKKGQTLENLNFILRNESAFPNCKKKYIINRIIDKEQEEKIVKRLQEEGCDFVKIPFSLDEYLKIPLDISGVPQNYFPYRMEYQYLSEPEKQRIKMRICRLKNNYVMNNNGARNVALRRGKSEADWVLPWDGNCFMTESAWKLLYSDVKNKKMPYFFVPMARIEDNQKLLEDLHVVSASEEPQMVFHCNSKEEFNEEFYYGRRPKVELFWRLGIAGDWDNWPIEPWDLPCPEYSPDAGMYSSAGWVARLFSGQAHLENGKSGLVDRGLARNEAIADLLERLDSDGFKARYDSQRLCYVAEVAEHGCIKDPFNSELLRNANASLSRGPYSVIDKKTLPPSRNLHDYWHPAPYFWPNPIPMPGLPYIRKDGKRVPGTRLYEPLSDNYDRTRLQRLFDDTFSLSLAGSVSKDERYDAHAVKLVCTWFLNPETAMSPHLEYAQVRKGWNKNKGSSSGIIEAKDFYYFLDAVRLLERREKLTKSNSNDLREWLSKYLHWLRTSPQGVKERSALNNHGTYYDLQVGAIAAFLGEDMLLRHTLRDSRFRIVQQFSTDGSQPEELKRTTTAHYCCFNLQGWIHLAQLAESCGEDLWSFEGPEGQSIRRAMEWLLPYIDKNWPFQQIDEFDSERFYPIYYAYLSRYGKMSGLEHLEIPSKEEVKPLFFPHDGIRPFWQLS
ncbi:alginate lyase family protein [Billgrantia aerodenitrificans]|uniref:Alginate lyase family protein n=1 Tax=Billgrantia aerodenitrificans TaxID=2733483 RepID=A0ABS9AYH3_9GAMM|nr:alginate lyase family protein [Halomonas aerodenitrificans]MCE8026966.1 alginate lyase family protein [Halomonas aerodenitrificans]